MSAAEARAAAVAEAIDDIRGIVGAGEVTREQVERVRDRLVELAARRELFSAAELAPPAPDAKLSSCLYRLAEDPDGRFALYANACRDRTDSPPHNHTTWAVIVGFEGQELNRFYRRDGDGGVEAVREEMVEAGAGVAMLGDDVHSIHIRGGALNFHLYGLALERLVDREYFKAEDRTWRRFPAHLDIREARP
ncbi:MAG: cysteine dioxygenase [Acidimicrobiales bacterium]